MSKYIVTRNQANQTAVAVDPIQVENKIRQDFIDHVYLDIRSSCSKGNLKTKYICTRSQLPFLKDAIEELKRQGFSLAMIDADSLEISWE